MFMHKIFDWRLFDSMKPLQLLQDSVIILARTCTAEGDKKTHQGSYVCRADSPTGTADQTSKHSHVQIYSRTAAVSWRLNMQTNPTDTVHTCAYSWKTCSRQRKEKIKKAGDWCLPFSCKTKKEVKCTLLHLAELSFKCSFRMVSS